MAQDRHRHMNYSAKKTASTLLSAAALSASMSVAPAVAQDWTGFYGGTQLQYFFAIEGATNRDGEGVTAGLHAGYRHQYMEFVLGAEIESNFFSFGMNGGNRFENYTAPKLKVGYANGPALVSGIIGLGYYGTNFGQMRGGIFGASVEYMVKDNWSVGVEALYHDIADHGSPFAFNPNPRGIAGTVGFKTSYNF